MTEVKNVWKNFKNKVVEALGEGRERQLIKRGIENYEKYKITKN